MRSMKINREWDFGLGQVDLGKRSGFPAFGRSHDERHR
jgi:hypothetical protein